MNKPKHTLGPWNLVKDSGGDWYVSPVEVMCPAVPVSTWITPEEAKANARLVAAAPELLEACKGVLRFGAELDRAGIINDPAIQAVRDAITIAEGRTL